MTLTQGAEVQPFERFRQAFGEEHRLVRDLLLELVDAFRDRDVARARDLLDRTAAATGPHFRYEEEAMYPLLVQIFGPEYIAQLLRDHDRVIGSTERLLELIDGPSLSDEDVEEATRRVRGMLPHVSDCDGLSIMVERLPASDVKTILETRERSLRDDLDLLIWAHVVRGRPAARGSEGT
jgi:hypothetical protein